MRLLRPLACACAIGPLALAAGAGLFVGSMMCVAVGARNRIVNGGKAAPEGEGGAARPGTTARAAAAGARRRRRAAL